jgi:putative PIN family toxin of toxin-antitoxin system
MRVFLDTNVLVSATATRGLCADVLYEVFASHELIISEYVLDEVKRALTVKLGVPRDAAEEYLWLLRQESVVASEADAPALRLRDSTDIPVLAAALQAHAEVLVTGDKELQELAHIEQLDILSPRGFWERLRARSEGQPEK